MKNHILHDIRRMYYKHEENNCLRSKTLYLSPVDESRLAAYIISVAMMHEEDREEVNNILEHGIRDCRLVILGMSVRFDAPKLAVGGTETGIMCFECGQWSGIDCPGRKPGESTRCVFCLEKFLKMEQEEIDRIHNEG